ncbi:hypothetical protein [Derxia gummosa]|uniref:Uncharacterized protein n=1 Tax=Derxia gummosa DSM 723 TaxID=1121388 RepID=A0A8B6X2C0_9BURK|nr:hypothetical protein [Derxia gummosa]
MISFTPFFPAFVVLLLMSLRGMRGWLAAVALAAFFQGATPFVLGGAARDAGLAPAYLLLPIGVWHYLRWRMPLAGRARDLPLTPAHWALIAFTAVGVAGAVLLPRLFAGEVLVLPSRAQRFLRMEPVMPQGTNLFQGFYLVMNYALFALVARFVSSGRADEAGLRKWVVRGAVLSALVGLYQWGGSFVGAYWPSEFFNSNTGVIQLGEQQAMGFRRISSTFIEPSVLGYHFAGCLGLMLFSARHARAGLLLLAVLLLSLASSGYVIVAGLTAAWLVIGQAPAERKRSIFIALLLLGLAGLAADFVFADGRLFQSLILDKGASESGQVRATWNLMAWESFAQSWGLGAGVGSARGSSFVATLAATMGLPGLALFALFLWRAIRAGLAEREATGQGYGFALIAFSLGWCLAMPDLSLPLVWICAGAAAGLQLDAARRAGEAAGEAPLSAAGVPAGPPARPGMAAGRPGWHDGRAAPAASAAARPAQARTAWQAPPAEPATPRGAPT